MSESKNHPLTLRFQDSEIEEAYRAYDFSRSVLQGRIAIVCVLGAFLLSGVFDDQLFQADSLPTVWAIRAGVLLIVAAIFAWTFQLRFKQYNYLPLALVGLAGGVGIVLINTQLSPGSDERYFPVLITTIFFIYNVIGTRFIYALAVACLIIFVAYNLSMLWRGNFDVGTLLMRNNFVFFANLMGGSAGYITEMQRRKLFLGQRVLQEKIAEAERAKLEAEQANQTKSRFLAAVSHDVRQPIHAQGLFLNVLVQTDLNPRQREIVASISSASTAAEEMLHALLDLSHMETGAIQLHKRAFQLQPLLNKIEAEFMPQANAKGLQYRSRETQLVAYSDSALVEIILRNLVANAIRYTPAGGIMVACRRRGNNVALEVRDSGIGIEASQHREIFREFYQLSNPERDRRKGIGLGLAIVEGLVKKLGLTLSLASQPGRGSVFRIGIPLATAAYFEETVAPQQFVQHETNIRILLVEDDELAREGAREQLTTWGFICDAAASADAALAAAQANAPQLIVSDYRLPGLHTGVALVREIRAQLQRPALPAVLITGDVATKHIGAELDIDMHLLHKPVAPSALYRAIVGSLSEAAEA